MMRVFKYIFILLLGVFILTGNSWATSFIEGLEDVPVMKGLNPMPKDNISFGNEESRFVETYLTSSKVGFKTVEKFYTETLPQLGWTYQGKRENTLIFYRENETIEIVPEQRKPLIVRITVKNKI